MPRTNGTNERFLVRLSIRPSRRAASPSSCAVVPTVGVFGLVVAFKTLPKQAAGRLSLPPRDKPRPIILCSFFFATTALPRAGEAVRSGGQYFMPQPSFCLSFTAPTRTRTMEARVSVVVRQFHVALFETWSKSARIDV